MTPHPTSYKPRAAPILTQNHASAATSGTARGRLGPELVGCPKRTTSFAPFKLADHEWSTTKPIYRPMAVSFSGQGDCMVIRFLDPRVAFQSNIQRGTRTMTLARLQSLPETASRDSREDQVSNKNFGRDTDQAAHSPPPAPEAGDDFHRQLAALIQAIDATSHKRAPEAVTGSGVPESTHSNPLAASEPGAETVGEPESGLVSAHESSPQEVSGYEPGLYEAAEEPEPYETYYGSPEQGIEYGSLPNVLTQAKAEHAATIEPGFAEDDDEDFDKPAFALINPSALLSGRVIGFVAGLGTSVAVGGMVLFGGSFTEPTAVASYVSSADSAPAITAPDEAPASLPTKLQSRLANAVAPDTTRIEAQLTGTVIEGTPQFSAEAPSDGASERSLAFANVGETSVNPPAAPLPEQIAATPVVPEAQAGKGGSPEPTTETAALVEQDPAQPSVPEQPQNPANQQAPEEVQLQFDTVVAPSEPAEPPREAVVKRDVNMRAGPDISEPVVTIVSGGSPIEVISCNGWCEVVYAGKRGWIYKDFIEVSSLEGNGAPRTRSDRL